jgi:hypothetical protein
MKYGLNRINIILLTQQGGDGLVLNESSVTSCPK